VTNKIEEIRTLLSELEGELQPDAANETMRVFSGLELPDIVRDIVDLLIPCLKPYEAAFYWYFFRHSVVESGSQILRVGYRGLRSGVVRSPYSESRAEGSRISAMSEKSARDTLRGLEEIGAIRKEGEPTRDGTLYRILLPEEISVCQIAREARDKKAAPRAADDTEADYYNVRENRLKIYERDGYKCQHCGKQLTRFTATLDHVRAVTHGGDNSMGNLVTACVSCNSRKNSRLLGDFLADENPTR
jgi:hypothetical protein